MIWLVILSCLGLLMFCSNCALKDSIRGEYGARAEWLILINKGILALAIILLLPVIIPLLILAVVYRVIENKFGKSIQDSLNWLLNTQKEKKEE